MKKSLKIRKPIGRTLGWASLTILLLLSLTEILLHFQFIQDILPYPSIGSGHHRLDFKVALLDKLIEKEGRVDCIFLGGSNVNAAMNPEIFSQAHEKKQGEKKIFFNFGIDGALMAASGYLAEILTKKYQPGSIIYGYNPIGFSSTFRKKTKDLILGNPWCRYHLGQFSLGGWLAEHSKTYGYFLRFRIWLEQNRYSKRLAKLQRETTPFGFSKSKTILPFKANTKKKQWHRRIQSEFSISADEMAGFRRILDLSTKANIVFAEMPFYPGHQSYIQLDQTIIDEFNNNIIGQINQSKITFIPLSHLEPVPPEGYRDIAHMNKLGARIYSRSLSEYIVNHTVL